MSTTPHPPYKNPTSFTMSPPDPKANPSPVPETTAEAAHRALTEFHVLISQLRAGIQRFRDKTALRYPGFGEAYVNAMEEGLQTHIETVRVIERELRREVDMVCELTMLLARLEDML